MVATPTKEEENVSFMGIALVWYCLLLNSSSSSSSLWTFFVRICLFYALKRETP